MRTCMFKGVCMVAYVTVWLCLNIRVVIDRMLGHTVCQGSVFHARAMSFSSQVSGLAEREVDRTDKQGMHAEE